MAVSYKPEGYHTVTPYLAVNGAAGLIDFIRQAFGAEEMFRMDQPGGKVGHAEMRLGDSIIMLGDAMDQPRPGQIHLYVEDCDGVYQRAMQAGGESEREPENMFYGDRTGGVRDRFGNLWWIATHIEDVPPEEMEQRAQAAMAQA